MADTVPEDKRLTVYQGGLSDEQAAANKVRRKLDEFKEACVDARSLGLSIRLMDITGKDLARPGNVHVTKRL